MAKIVIDAGHGRYGNKSPNNANYIEGTQMWHLSVYLEKALMRLGHEVITTRPNINNDPTLTQRGRMGEGADFLFSLHSNAPDKNKDGTYSKDVTGTVVFYSLAHPESKALAEALGNKVSEMMGHHFRGAMTKESDKPNVDYYGVIRNAASVGCPAMIIEHGFHTNLKDSNFLLESENLKALADAEAKVIADYFSIKAEKKWYTDAQRWVVENGIADGTRPDEFATRAEVWTMLQRFKSKE